MTDVLNSYLIQHKSINIPGLGTIYVETVPARNDFVNKQLHPPFLIYRFDKYFDAPDKDFFTYIASYKNMADYEAIRWYNEFAYNLRAQIRINDETRWEGIGIFRKDTSGEILFEEDRKGLPLYVPVAAERVIRTNASHQMMVGDRETTTAKMTELLNEDDIFIERESWWIYALILAAAGICLGFFYFYRYGFSIGSIFK